LLEKILELLAAIAVALGAAVPGLSTAQENVAHGVPTEIGSVQFGEELAELQAAGLGTARVAEARIAAEAAGHAETGFEASTDATATALETLATVMANAPDAALPGLETTADAVANGGPPETTPASEAAPELPVEPPVGAP